VEPLAPVEHAPFPVHWDETKQVRTRFTVSARASVRC
jgi:hypothetical protein